MNTSDSCAGISSGTATTPRASVLQRSGKGSGDGQNSKPHYSTIGKGLATSVGEMAVEDLKHIHCPVCGNIAKEVINAGENRRVGWYCTHCSHFEKAIGRERKR